MVRVIPDLDLIITFLVQTGRDWCMSRSSGVIRSHQLEAVFCVPKRCSSGLENCDESANMGKKKSHQDVWTPLEKYNGNRHVKI
jgi:hypothetical protein